MKKIISFLFIVALVVLGYLYATDKISLARLKSSALNTDTCSPAYIREKAAEYHQASFNQQENTNQITAIKAELLKLEAQKSTASEVESEVIVANIAAQEKALEMLEAMEVDELIGEYEACKQDLLFKWLISGEVNTPAVVSAEVQKN